MRAIAILVLVVAIAALAVHAKPLDDYVNRFDPAFQWTDTGISAAGPGCTFHVLNMTSQSWLTPADVTSPRSGNNKWQHYLLVAIPTVITVPNKMVLYITSGNNDGVLPVYNGVEAQILIAMGVQLGMVAAAVYQVPNQPLVFSSDPVGPTNRRSEDAILALSWLKFVDNNNPEWVARLPMTKAAVRAVDATIAFVKQKTNNKIKKYVVAGASKRGWTAWLTAAVDDRVVGVLPMVMDLLNFNANIHHHYRAYGGWTFALFDYYSLNLTSKFDEPGFQRLMEIEDPISYKNRLTMPKLVIDAGNDEFFLPDDQMYWWDTMPGKKYSLMNPNVGHSLAQQLPQIVAASQTFIASIVNNIQRPRYSFNHNQVTGTITVNTNDTPSQVKLWYAYSAAGTGRRDFRQAAGFPPAGQSVPWLSTTLTAAGSGGNRWIGQAPTPPTGQWTAYYVELLFPAPSPLTPFRFTTTTAVFPNTFPSADCSGAACHGVLL